MAFNFSILNVPDEGYSKNASCPLNLISTLFITAESKLEHNYICENWSERSIKYRLSFTKPLWLWSSKWKAVIRSSHMETTDYFYALNLAFHIWWLSRFMHIVVVSLIRAHIEVYSIHMLNGKVGHLFAAARLWFLHQQKLPLWYSWSIVSGVKAFIHFIQHKGFYPF